jgi:hypothetical protein
MLLIADLLSESPDAKALCLQPKKIASRLLHSGRLQQASPFARLRQRFPR